MFKLELSKDAVVAVVVALAELVMILTGLCMTVIIIMDILEGVHKWQHARSAIKLIQLIQRRKAQANS